jgi:hypothetical protein
LALAAANACSLAERGGFGGLADGKEPAVVSLAGFSGSEADSRSSGGLFKRGEIGDSASAMASWTF